MNPPESMGATLVGCLIVVVFLLFVYLTLGKWDS